MQRLRGEIPKVYKIVKAVDELNCSPNPTIRKLGALDETGGRLVYNRQKKVLLYTADSELWNLLPQETVEADSIDRFKNGLDKLMDNRSINRY